MAWIRRERMKSGGERGRVLMMRAAKHASVALLTTAALGASTSCNDFDSTRQAPPKATLGDDFYGVLCDRVGASVLAEDLSGASYSSICHYDNKGNYGNAVDTKLLPAVSGATETQARQLAIAKLTRMAARRGDLVRAINAVFPKETTVKDDSGKQVPLHAALMDFAQRFSDLYDSNPYDSQGEPLVPSATRALGRFFDSFSQNNTALSSLAHIWGRRGYRPSPVGLGAVRAALSYPGLRALANATLDVIGPKAQAAPVLQQLLTVSKKELQTSTPVLEPLPAYQVDASTVQPNRPRSSLEVVQAILLAQDDTFAVSDGDPSLYISPRDRRGFAIPASNTPGTIGTVMPPFADVDGDGFADVDASGRFVDASGMPLSIDPPFVIPGVTTSQADPYGRAVNAPYAYLDTSRALTGALARHLANLVDPTVVSPNDPNAYQQEHETLEYALAGLYALSGSREPAQYDYTNNVVKGPNDPCEDCVSYSRFKAEESPIVDITHAVGQILADKDSDAILASLIDLVENHEDVVARLVGAALEVRQISLQHDQMAQAGQEPLASLPYQDPIWDEMAQLLWKLAEQPGLGQRAIEALADSSIVSQQGTSQNMGQTTATFATTVDQFDYDTNDLNGPAVNVSVGNGSTADPQVPIQPSQPRNGANISLLQRSLQVIHDANRASTCNKQGALIHTNLGIDWPIWPAAPYNECELTRFANEAVFYLDSNLPATHPKRSQMVLMGAINDILSIGSDFGIDPDTVVEGSSGIQGLGLHPESYALTRLLFFGAESDNLTMPDLDPNYATLNAQTDQFIHDLIEPAGGLPCAQDANGVNTCTSPSTTLRVRDKNTMFAWERLGFLTYLKPVIRAFADQSCTADESACDASDISGEQLLVDMFDELNFHWPGADHGDECSNSGDKTSNPIFCAQSGLNRYEPLLGDALRTDLIPALNAFAEAAKDLSNITVQRGPHAGETWTGTQVLEKVTRVLFDQTYAQMNGMVDRNGNASAHWVDGTPQAQLTPFTLFGDALHNIDTTFANTSDGAARQAMWKRARSLLVDEFLSVDGEGTSAQFHDRAFPKTLSTILRVMREQVNANCPNRESGAPCTWASHDLAAKLQASMSGPLYAAILDLNEALRSDEDARRALEAFLQYTLQASSSGDALQATLASMSDMLQVLADDDHMAPILNAVATAASPDADPNGPGAADTTIRVTKALVGSDYDRYHILDVVLPNLVTPIDDASPSPIEIFLDVISDVDRVDASSDDPLGQDDYGTIMTTVRDFMTDDTRGLEQLYAVMKNRPTE